MSYSTLGFLNSFECSMRGKMFSIPKIDDGKTKKSLTSFIKFQATTSGAKSLILGLSGGLDSACVAFLVRESNCEIPLKLHWLPYKSSSPESLEDAQKVAKALELPLQTIDITNTVDASIESWGVDSKLRIGNLAARARMMALFDSSSKHSGVILGTSNLSERLLGYGTLHGDLACAFNPIANLFKTEIIQISKHLGIPESVISKRPTADLWKDQTDEAELGFSYQDADRVLFLTFRLGLTKDEVEDYGIPPELTDKILSRVNQNSFKSKPIPLGPVPVNYD